MTAYLYERFKKNPTGLVYTMVHPHNDCIYQECHDIIALRLDRVWTILRVFYHLRCERFPEHHGLHETRVMLRPNNEVGAAMNENWWQMIDRYSQRDQLSFDYVCWIHRVPIQNIFDQENLYTKSGKSCIRIRQHKSSTRFYYPTYRWLSNPLSRRFPICVFLFPLVDFLYSIKRKILCGQK